MPSSPSIELLVKPCGSEWHEFEISLGETTFHVDLSFKGTMWWRFSTDEEDLFYAASADRAKARTMIENELAPTHGLLAAALLAQELEAWGQRFQASYVEDMVKNAVPAVRRAQASVDGIVASLHDYSTLFALRHSGPLQELVYG